MLDILDELEVKATFFVTGNNFAKGHIDDSSTPWPPILRRMHDAGHQIASHTWTHRDLTIVNKTIQRSEMIYNEMAFRNLFGWFPTYMRPPYLDCDNQSGCLDLMKQLGYHVIIENIDTKDYMYDDPQLIQMAKDRFAQGESASDPSSNEYITLAHDVHYQTVVNLTRFMVETSRNRGYSLPRWENVWEIRKRTGIGRLEVLLHVHLLLQYPRRLPILNQLLPSKYLQISNVVATRDILVWDLDLEIAVHSTAIGQSISF